MASAPFLGMESTPDYTAWEMAVKKFPEKSRQDEQSKTQSVSQA